jgi:hypothetical protein
MVKVHFENIREKILTEIDLAVDEIIVAVYWFTNHELFEKLINKVENGVKVHLIIHNDYINNREAGLPFQNLIDKGGEFYFSDSQNPMHNKFCVIDNKTLINGSYNWTYYAENRNRENIIVIKDEDETISAFHNEFSRLKELSVQIDIIRYLTKFEVDENNELRARDYLANDIVYQAKFTNKHELIYSAFEIAPQNIEVQKVAHSLDLTKKYRLKHSIGSSLINDGYRIIVEKGSSVPAVFSSIVKTSADNQTTTEASIHYGENPLASKNVKFAEMKLYGLPPKPAGQAEIKYHFTIDLFGNLRMEKYSLDNGKKQIINKKITGLLEEIKIE